MSEEKKEEIQEEYDIDTLFKDSRRHQSGTNLAVGIYGDTEVGKTYLALDFPGPIRVVNLDYGLTENLDYYPDKEITDMTPTDYKDAEIKEDDYKWDKVNPINSLKKFEKGLGTLIRTQHGGTVVIDTMTTVNEWLKLLLDYKTDEANMQNDGKIAMFDWKWVNSKWKWLWQLIKSIDANVVVLFRTREVYENFKKTGKLEPDYRDGTKYEVSVEIELSKEVDQDKEGNVNVRRFAKFNKFRGVKLSKNYKEENLTYKRLIEILKEEGKV